MGIKISRKKPRNYLVTILYRIKQILPMSDAAKFRLFLNLEWVFYKLAHTMSFKYYSADDHPARQCSKIFILKKIKETSINTISSFPFSFMVK